MKATDVLDIIRLCNMNNFAVPLGMELSALSYKELLADLYGSSAIFAAGPNRTAEGFMLYGINFTPRRCTCGAHPEDQR